MTWSGLVVILATAFLLSATTPYPGSLVAIPVVGAGLVVAGGVGVPRWGAEVVLKLGPAQWLGRLSYSLYLWHWPILVIAAQHAGKATLPLGESLFLVTVAVGLSMVTYSLVEAPVRHSRLTPRQSVVLGAVLVGSTVVILTIVLPPRPSGASLSPVTPAPNAHAVHQAVNAATGIKKVPADLLPPLGTPAVEWDDGIERPACIATLAESKEAICTLGDERSKNLMVVYGDSHAAMWLPAFQWIAATAHWKLVVLSKPYCPAVRLTIADPPGLGGPDEPDRICDEWHLWATKWMNDHRPQLLVVTQESIYKVPVPGGASRWAYIPEWRAGLRGLFASLTDKQTRTVILGNIPVLAQPGPQCLSAHQSDVQACSTSVSSAVQFSNGVESQTAAELGSQYIDTIPWFCSSVCTAVIGRYNVYLDGVHITAAWATYLERVIGQALGLVRGG